MDECLKLRAGEWVEIRSKEEILETLDGRGRLDELPFMPEMLQHCGKRYRVHKRAHKTCDPPTGIGGRRMKNAVLIGDVRCDGRAHGDCEAGCLIFWKEAWLKRVDGEQDDAGAAPSGAGSPARKEEACTEADIFSGAYGDGEGPESEDPTYVCQATQMARATEALPWWDVRQYVEDYTSGNVRFSQMVVAFLFFLYHNLASAGLGIGSAMRGAYDVLQKLRGGTPYPWRWGRIPKGKRTPSERLNLEPGEWVRVRPQREILETLDEGNLNRGMYFDGEMVPFCGGSYQVLRPVRRIINEKTGKMLCLKNSAIILKDVVCQARYSKCRRFCPRGIFPYWREIWLERVPAEKVPSPSGEGSEKD